MQSFKCESIIDFFGTFKTETKGVSSTQIANHYSISHPTACLFIHKVYTAMKSSELYPSTGTVYINEFVFKGKEDLKQGRRNDNKKNVTTVEIDDKSGIKRAYFKRIKDYLSAELSKIFNSHISTQAKVKMDRSI